MQILKDIPNFDFVGKRKIAMVLSTLLIIASIVSLSTRGLSLGLDFKGGILLEIGYSQPIEVEKVRSAIAEAGYKDAVVQHIGSAKNISLRVAKDEQLDGMKASNELEAVLREKTDKQLEVRRREFVGAKVGEELREDGGIAMLIALGGILIYVMLRFQIRFSLGAIAALIHDVIITLGFFSFFQWEFDLTVLAAVLAVIGYSLNDTIVVYDRIRENFRKMRKGSTLHITNASLNQTISRTIVTSFTTILVLAAMLVLGGDLIKVFAIALIIGVVVGTYSSIYVASSMVIALKIERSHLMTTIKEDNDRGDGSHP